MLTQKDLYEKQQHGTRVGMDPVPMPPTKVQAFLEEFPWIRKHVNEPIAQVYVSRVESSILNYFLHSIDIEMFSRMWEKITLLNEKGEEVIGEIKKWRKKFFFWGPPVARIKRISGTIPHHDFRTGYTPSVGTITERLGEKADSVRFLLSYYSYTQAVIVYKLPKGISMRQWIKNETELEKARLRGEVDSIN